MGGDQLARAVRRQRRRIDAPDNPGIELRSLLGDERLEGDRHRQLDFGRGWLGRCGMLRQQRLGLSRHRLVHGTLAGRPRRGRGRRHEPRSRFRRLGLSGLDGLHPGNAGVRLDHRRGNGDGAHARRRGRAGIGRSSRLRRGIVAAATLSFPIDSLARHGGFCFARAGSGVEHRGEALLEFALIGRGDEGAAGRRRHAGERLQARRLVVDADHMDAQALGLLLERGGGGADIGVAAVAAVGDQHDVELAIGWRALGGIAQRGGDRGRALGLDRAQHLRLRRRRQRAGLRHDLAVGAVRRLAMAEGDEPERKPVAIAADGGAELRPDGGDLARSADLLVHAARGIEHDDRSWRGGIGRLGWRVLGESSCPRSRKSGGQEREPKPRAAFPPHVRLLR